MCNTIIEPIRPLEKDELMLWKIFSVYSSMGYRRYNPYYKRVDNYDSGYSVYDDDLKAVWRNTEFGDGFCCFLNKGYGLISCIRLHTLILRNVAVLKKIVVPSGTLCWNAQLDCEMVIVPSFKLVNSRWINL